MTEDLTPNGDPAEEDTTAGTKSRGPGKKRQSLSDQVYHQLRREIITCQHPPGSELSEAMLAERFEVSKTPVREALAMLRLDGLVMIYPRLGYQITPITFSDINENFDLRIILEVGAGKLACAHATNDEIARLRQIATQENLLSQRSPLTDFIQANRDFHLAIAQASRNSRLASALDKLMIEMERFFYLGATLRDVRAETNDHHEQIIRALEQRDVLLVSALLTRHNEDTRQGLIAALTRAPGPGKITF